jgi:hypothetical protein
MSLKTKHLPPGQAMDSIKDQPAPASADDVQGIGEIGSGNALCVFGVGGWVGQELPRGDLKPDAVVAPPGQIEVPAERFEFEALSWELERPEALAVPIDREQPTA